MNPKVDQYIAKASIWKKEMETLRQLALDCGLQEDLKWGKPCYSFNNSNIVVIQGFKSYCALLFFKGMLLSDADGLLRKTGENTRVGRQIRVESVKEIAALANKIKAYIYEAIELEKSGAKIPKKGISAPKYPEELEARMNRDNKFKAAFEALTPGRQRGYVIFFSQAKQSETRIARIEKASTAIMKGKGLNDR